ncbi:uncharacterized protein L969DRAFT_19940 [Mixia osmundae IAM 14324]|uniref:uncharacterized protein n=1 Tax=Mixia osmundae (strain CBS 9802 / IAM 14324 / JCM 22182 / KY 12970) TaxID=764103 RepID=UPI0004A54730|nr:uncharacterized protein L969DRAFT_19940 [Mixia osmundae IAM 14324]KEI36940.1 hypothetical protein L969DRAFT_19940 [Mixia osmundae IAM 14324]
MPREALKAVSRSTYSDAWRSHYPRLHSSAFRTDETVTNPDEPRPLPPAYKQTTRANEIPLEHTRSRGERALTTSRSTLHTLEWHFHPALTGWKRSLHCIQGRGEQLDDTFPLAFSYRCQGVGPLIDAQDRSIELSQTMSSHASSFTSHALYKQYQTRLAFLNECIPAHLVKTRLVMVLLELINALWLVLLIIALAVDRAQQRGFLTAVEVTLVVIIIVNATGFNFIRIHRWKLQRTLRTKSLDWSPVLTTSTARTLLANYEGDSQSQRTVIGPQPALRWNLIAKEGSFWTAWRPICRLIMPSEPLTVPCVESEDVPGYAAFEPSQPTSESLTQTV